MIEKSDLRKNQIVIRKNLPEQKRLEDSESVIGQLVQMQCVQEADKIFCYVAKTPELSLDSFIDWCLEQGKKVAVPRVSGENMDFYFINSREQLIEGAFGILEPMPECEKADIGAEICFVPGVAFDLNGNRMGYGKGYYDKYFATHFIPYKIGVCFDEQIVNQIPTDEFDIRMDEMITPSRKIEVE